MPWFGMADRYPSRNLFKSTDAKDAFARFFFFFWSNILHPYEERRNKTNCSDVLRHSLNPLLRQLSLLTQVWFTHYTQNRWFLLLVVLLLHIDLHVANTKRNAGCSWFLGVLIQATELGSLLFSHLSISMWLAQVLVFVRVKIRENSMIIKSGAGPNNVQFCKCLLT